MHKTFALSFNEPETPLTDKNDPKTWQQSVKRTSSWRWPWREARWASNYDKTSVEKKKAPSKDATRGPEEQWRGPIFRPRSGLWPNAFAICPQLFPLLRSPRMKSRHWFVPERSRPTLFVVSVLGHDIFLCIQVIIPLNWR